MAKRMNCGEVKMTIRGLSKYKFKRLLREHVQAQKELAWLGATDPHDHDAIKNNARLARKKLFDFMEEFFENDTLLPW
jgi:hypothetical protein